MGSIYRSETMCLTQIFIQNDTAYDTVSEIGELGIVQFNDLNPDLNVYERKYAPEVRRCAEMERKLKIIKKEIEEEKVPIAQCNDNPRAPNYHGMNVLESKIDALSSELKEINDNDEVMLRNYNELLEMKHLMQKAEMFFNDEYAANSIVLIENIDFENDGLGGDIEMRKYEAARRASSINMKLGFITGTLENKRLPGFQRFLFRATNGNCYLRFEDIEEKLVDNNGAMINKVVFIVFYQGTALKEKIIKICNALKATMYNCPDGADERQEMSLNILQRIEDLKTVRNETSEHRHKKRVAIALELENWFIQVRKIKAIYHTLNLCNRHLGKDCVVAEAWCPHHDIDALQASINMHRDTGSAIIPNILTVVPTKKSPPTFNRTNKLTNGFQNIVDAYGYANYREINPTPFSVITFPFLFAVMFGDAGHGAIMFAAALYLCCYEKKLAAKNIRDEIFQTFFGGRYVILLMGIFAIYAGFVYNDILSRSINIFGSGWTVPEIDHVTHGTLQLNPATDFTGDVYWFGIDPVWNLASNKLSFLNSFKMKVSIIMGISQMALGVFLSLFNFKYFHRYNDIINVFIPQLLFLSLIFVYLCVLVIMKWLMFGVFPKMTSVGIYPSSHCAPSLLIGFINMFMMKNRDYGFVTGNNTANCLKMDAVPGTCHELPSCNLTAFYTGQKIIESVFVLVALLCIPWMLFGKPIVKLILHKRSQKRNTVVPSESTIENGNGIDLKDNNGANGKEVDDKPIASEEPEEAEFEFGELMIYSAIHTIEFSLGCISHTASYLRLWALSLAHAQLSDVLWNMVLARSFSIGADGSVSPIMIIAIFLVSALFSILTFSILILMEALSAFLHALRLHWVEFQSKFYGGEGYPFDVFSFKKILAEAESIDHYEQHG